MTLGYPFIQNRGGLLVINFGAGLGSGDFSANFSVAPVLTASSFRDVKRIGEVSAIPSTPSASVVQRNQPFPNIIIIFFHGLYRIG